MNEFSQLNAMVAEDLQRHRSASTRRPAAPVTVHRRTTRRVVAAQLHRFADRLDR